MRWPNHSSRSPLAATCGGSSRGACARKRRPSSASYRPKTSPTWRAWPTVANRGGGGGGGRGGGGGAPAHRSGRRWAGRRRSACRRRARCTREAARPAGRASLRCLKVERRASWQPAETAARAQCGRSKPAGGQAVCFETWAVGACDEREADAQPPRDPEAQLEQWRVRAVHLVVARRSPSCLGGPLAAHRAAHGTRPSG